MPPPGEDQSLAGCGVLVTRPAGFNTGLIAALSAVGAKVLEFPLLSIEACAARTALFLSSDGQLDGLIFTSRNAVEHAFAQWPRLLDQVGAARISAVGAGTARALEAQGVAQVLIPRGHYSSEGLLSLAEFQHPSGQLLGIVSGRGGRTLLADTLRARGARVECLEVYRRLPTTADVNNFLRRHGGDIQILVMTSSEALRVLVDRTGGRVRETVVDYPLVAASARIAATAERFGFNSAIEVAEQVCDEALVGACRRLWRLIGQ